MYQHTLILLSDTFSGSTRHFFGGYFRKVAYFQIHLWTRAASFKVPVYLLIKCLGGSDIKSKSVANCLDELILFL